MAVGDIVWFDQALLDLGSKKHNLGSDTLKLGIVKSAANGGVDPAATTSDPRWGAGGSTNLSSSQVATAGTSYTGPQTLASVTWSLVTGVATLRAAVVTLAQDASGFTNGRWGIIYNDTSSGKEALAYVDLGTDRSLANGALTIDWYSASNDILTLDQA